MMPESTAILLVLLNRALESFVSDLKSDFDSAITSRFNLSQDYQTALSDTSEEAKKFVTDAIDHFVSSKQSYGSGTFTVEGFGSGVPQPLDRVRITCFIHINGGITFECTLTKD